MSWLMRYRPYRNRIAVTAGFLLPIGVAGLLVPFRTTFADAAASLVLAAVVTAVATLGTRPAGYVAAASASLSFDYFLTRPYEQLVINRSTDIEITVSLFVVGVVITELAARSRRNYHDAQRESSYVDRIYQVSELVAAGGSVDKVLEMVRAELVDLLNLRDCRFERTRIASWARQLERDGQVVVCGCVWPVESWGLPGPELSLVALSRGRPVGRFVFTPTPGEPVSQQRRLVAVAIVDQVGSLLMRHLHAA